MRSYCSMAVSSRCWFSMSFWPRSRISASDGGLDCELLSWRKPSRVGASFGVTGWGVKAALSGSMETRDCTDPDQNANPAKASAAVTIENEKGRNIMVLLGLQGREIARNSIVSDSK